jgi:hypothetical protein
MVVWVVYRTLNEAKFYFREILETLGGIELRRGFNPETNGTWVCIYYRGNSFISVISCFHFQVSLLYA